MEEDTIVAVSTAPGRGGIGIVRLSGTRAVAIAQQLVARARPQAEAVQTFEHARARFVRLVDEAGATVDEAVVTAFLAPQSYTGEDVVELAAHGSPVVLEFVVQRAWHWVRGWQGQESFRGERFWPGAWT